MKISLIIPCHNHADVLPRAVESALRQDTSHEIVIIDDASTDNTLEVAKGLAALFPLISVIQTPKNIGPGATRNLGVSSSQGTFITFLDADDELQGSRYFHDALHLMETHSDLYLIKPDEIFFDPIKGYILPDYDPRYKAVVLSSVHGLFLRKATFLQIGGFPENAEFFGKFGGEDVAFMQAAIANFSPIGRIAEPVYRVWSSANSHVDSFLANTRLKEDSFVFLNPDEQQMSGGILERALSAYLNDVQRRFSP